MTQPYKRCPQCGQPAVLAIPTCRRYGYQYYQVPTAWDTHVRVEQPAVRAAVGIMWFLMVIAWILCASPETRAIGNAVDVVSVCVAIGLICAGSSYGRKHAWTRIGAEIVLIGTVLVYVLSVISAHQ